MPLSTYSTFNSREFLVETMGTDMAFEFLCIVGNANPEEALADLGCNDIHGLYGYLTA